MIDWTDKAMREVEAVRDPNKDGSTMGTIQEVEDRLRIATIYALLAIAENLKGADPFPTTRPE